MWRPLMTSAILLSGLTACTTHAPTVVCAPLTLPPELRVSRQDVTLGQPVTLTVTVPSPLACGGYTTRRVATYIGDVGQTLMPTDDHPLVFERTWIPQAADVVIPTSGVAEVPIFARADTSSGMLWAYPKPIPSDVTSRPSTVIYLRVTAP